MHYLYNMFALVDCNNFYASCERVFNPILRQKPIAILSNNDGCVIARSDEAKALGLPMGAPAFKFKTFFKANNIQLFSSNYALYGDMSSRVMRILEQFSPDVEVYSIDEAFLRLKGFDSYDLHMYGTEMRQRILKWTGIPTCVGIAPTKALSKVANKIARKFPKETGGVYVIDSEEKRIKALKWTQLKDVWGIGPALHKRLSEKQCKTAYDFVQLPDMWVRKTFSITEWKLKKDLLHFDSTLSKKFIHVEYFVEGNALISRSGRNEYVTAVRGVFSEMDSSIYTLSSGELTLGVRDKVPGVVVSEQLARDLRLYLDDEISILSADGIRRSLTQFSGPRLLSFSVNGFFTMQQIANRPLALVDLAAAQRLFYLKNEAIHR